ncbi:MAG TPA: hypothetical protein GXX72_05345 [Clostridiaceae bacterium]|nr:hypothetical protein [Clostridiaceae bacterium]
MKEFSRRASEIFRMIFGYGIMIVLFSGGLTFFTYVIAIIIGGETAALICQWVYESFIPAIIYASTILILFGLLTMYLAGEKALTPDKGNLADEGER